MLSIWSIVRPLIGLSLAQTHQSVDGYLDFRRLVAVFLLRRRFPPPSCHDSSPMRRASINAGGAETSLYPRSEYSRLDRWLGILQPTASSGCSRYQTNAVEVPETPLTFHRLEGRVYGHLGEHCHRAAQHDHPANQYHVYGSLEPVVPTPMVHGYTPSWLCGPLAFPLALLTSGT